MRLAILLSVAALAAGLCGSAAHADWITYDASLGTLPSAQGWTLFNNGDANWSSLYTNVSPTELRMDTRGWTSDPSWGHHHYWLTGAANLNFANEGFLLQAELKFDAFNGSGNTWFIEGRDGAQHRFALFFTPTQVQVQGEGGTYTYPFPAGYHDDYHSYRLEYNWITQERRFAIDGNELQSIPITLTQTGSATNRLAFGDGFTGAGADVFVRGFGFAPIPEPASAALLLAGGLAGLLAFGRRRRSWTRAGIGRK